MGDRGRLPPTPEMALPANIMPPVLCGCAESAADEEDKDGRLHDDMSAKDVGNLSVGREECRVGQDVGIGNPRLIWQFVKGGRNV